MISHNIEHCTNMLKTFRNHALPEPLFLHWVCLGPALGAIVNK